ncbi:hypothetical protein O3M35_004108 [Rhynocoris fuscipes]|uniref:Deacetylase sirtuin-type domain-containing protein n=1 Tax=Rhynocoris fuscipes TaxID=488301 RepID=A0AAW1CP10_9HEMI
MNELPKMSERNENNDNLSSSSSDSDDAEESDDRQGTSLKDKFENLTSRSSENSALSYLMSMLRIKPAQEFVESERLTYEMVIEKIKKNEIKNVITVVGAGISTAAGIPDFRSPGSGLYDNLQKYNLPYPQAIFELDYFVKHPEPFFHLAKELLPEKLKPTKAHYFIKLLQDKGILLRHYTQNIDNLERIAGISEEKLIEAHGTFYTSHCLNCNKSYKLDWLKDAISTSDIPKCVDCKELVKPDIIFFGEALPMKFFKSLNSDFRKCDLLIVMGSSLIVEPFASIITRTERNCPRIVINKHAVGGKHGLRFDQEGTRDFFLEGTCDDGCQKLAEELGWNSDLEELIKSAE